MNDLSDVRSVPGYPEWSVGEYNAGCVLLFSPPVGTVRVTARILAVDLGLSLHVLDDHRLVQSVPHAAYQALIDRAYGRAL